MARRVRTLSVKMRLRSVLTGGSPRESLNNVELEDHLECECEAQEVPHPTEEDTRSDCEKILFSCGVCLSLMMVSLGVVARHYRNKLNTLQESQLAVEKSKISRH